MVTDVPPEVGPEAGVIADMLGAEDSGRGVLLAERYPPELPQAVRRIVAAMTQVPTNFPPKEARYCSGLGNIIQPSHLSPSRKCATAGTPRCGVYPLQEVLVDLNSRASFRTPEPYGDNRTIRPTKRGTTSAVEKTCG